MENRMIESRFLFVKSIWEGSNEMVKEVLRKDGTKKKARYLLYSVNPGEGFNLRRDVYMRVANLVHKLNEKEHWILVLPPWAGIYHWHNDRGSGSISPWSFFFDILSLSKWVPVMEYHEWAEKRDGEFIFVSFVFLRYSMGWFSTWRTQYEPCRPHIDHTGGWESASGWQAWLWGSHLHVGNFSCLSVQGQAQTLLPLIEEQNGRSILFGRAETVLHDEYGGNWYWSARRSMRFAKHLKKEADQFRAKYLDSDDQRDKTEVEDDWRDTKKRHDSAIGGPYLGVHLRRQDFLHARGDQVPSLKLAAKQISKLLVGHNIDNVFIATDAPDVEFSDLKGYLEGYNVWRYKPNPEFQNNWGDGGVAIVDQIICSHARYFIGSYESTFSFRIQEEREILGFSTKSSFNRLCGKKKPCEQPSKWTIVY
ncbi:unnamed protein product, partial [Meganyctiphanes norvegica]